MSSKRKGPHYSDRAIIPPDSPYVWPGTTYSRAILNGKRADIQRSRVPKIDPESGQSKEVDLISWKAIKGDDSMREAAMRATLYGVSIRNIGKLSANKFYLYLYSNVIVLTP